jgi:hypothetical protein
MATTNSTPRSLVSLALPRPTPALLTYAAQIVKASTNNPSFPNLSPTIAALTQAIADLQAAEAAALSRGREPCKHATIFAGPRSAYDWEYGTERGATPDLGPDLA